MKRFLGLLAMAVSAVVILAGATQLALPTVVPFTTEQLLNLSVVALGLVALQAQIAEMQRESTKQALRGTVAEIIGPIADGVGVCTTAPDGEFFAVFPEQVRQAKTAVDVTNLAPVPPARRKGTMEKDYFDDLRALAKATKAHVRRVERLTRVKWEWIEEIVQAMRGVQNFDLAVFEDPFGNAEMTLTLSVQRVDNSVAWIVAAAEHEARRHPVRDICIRHPNAVALLADYYARLWARSTVLMKNGVVDAARLDEVKRRVLANPGTA